MPLTVERGAFGAVEGDWERLLLNSPADTVFITPWWQKVWWSNFGNDDDLHLITVRDQGEAVGIAPMSLRGGVLSFLGDTDLFDYHDFIVAPGYEAAFYDALCDYIIALDWTTMDLKSVREDSDVLKYLPALAEKKGISAEVTQEDVSPIASLAPTWDEYLSTLGRKDRHELRRKLRRLEASDHANQYACAGPESLDHCMEDFFRLLRASSPDKDEFLTPERERFFVDMAAELTPRGMFKLFFLEVAGVRVASCICFDYRGSYLLYNSGYDPEYSSLSVGLLNKALCIREAIEEGRGAFDFLRGTERYKYDLGGKDQVVYRLVVRR